MIPLHVCDAHQNHFHRDDLHHHDLLHHQQKEALRGRHDRRCHLLKTDEDEPGIEEASAQAEEAAKEIKAALGSKIPFATESDKDDLKQINGIGPAVESDLNSLGIYTFEQLSKFDDDLINKVESAIEFFPGRVKRDDWVGQAHRILSGENEAEDQSQKQSSEKPDNLKVIEGIGPKIESILKAGGINNWEDLANAQIDQLKDILAAAGDRYRVHIPDTWPKQAKMAFEGKWEELEAYQDALDGGKE